MSVLPTPLEITFGLAGLLSAGLVVASIQDWRRREVDDTVWQAHSGAGVGWAALGTTAPAPLAFWALGAFFVLEHLLPWDVPLEQVHPDLPGWIEMGSYAAVLVILGIGIVIFGVGPTAVPLPVIAVVASVLLARVLFELNILYGGADAKALMVAALLVPLFPSPLLPIPDAARSLLAIYPFALNLLMNGALLAAAIPIALAVRNLWHGTFDLRRGFTSFPLAVDRLHEEFVWVRDSRVEPVEEDLETSEEDHDLRVRLQTDLRLRGLTEVWVTPQLPFLLPLLAGTVTAILLGNLLFDLAALL
ncbi:MAG: hypothetical protein ACYDFT_02630 [Thermoplasmata archaeon]